MILKCCSDSGRYRFLFLFLLFSAGVFPASAQLPAQFDLRNVSGNNYVSGVRNQSGGTCWTHGTMAAMEGNLLMSGTWNAVGESGEPDLAEYHLDWWNGFNQHHNDDLDPPSGQGLEVHQGGDYRVATAYFSRGEGAVRDSDGQSYDTAPSRREDGYHYWVPHDVEWLSAGEDLSNIDEIKLAVMNYGVVATCMDYDTAFIDTQTYVHYQPASAEGDPNHSVAIVGWDDTKVVSGAPGPGAWLCKNSWGSSWGIDGYFWISYHDKHCGKHPEMGAVSFRGVAPPDWDRVYYHDYHGWRDTYTDADSGFAVFRAGDDEVLEKVNFVTAADDLDWTVRIWGSFSGGELQDLLGEGSGNFEHQGFHTVDLDAPVSLSRNEDFYVELEVSGGGMAFDRSSEVPVLLGGDSRTWVESAADAGESYVASGAGWVDFTTVDASGDLCIKAMTSLRGLKVQEVSVSPFSGPAGGPFLPDSVAFTLQAHGVDPISYEIRIESDQDWLAVDASPTGSLDAGGSLHIAFVPAVGAAALPAGAYQAEISFINTVDHAGDTVRTVLLLVGEAETLVMENMDADPGWDTGGQWEWGVPQGNGGDHGSPDPSSGATGAAVYGYNLAGDYPNNLGEEALTSTAFDLSSDVGVHLHFKRWLGVEQPQYDHASIEVSTDRLNWREIWKNDAAVDDGSWVDVDLDVSEEADGAAEFYIRWIMGSTDSGWTYCGWNIDDVRLSGYRLRSDLVFADNFESGSVNTWSWSTN